MDKREIALWGTMLAAPAQPASAGPAEPPAILVTIRGEAGSAAAGAFLLAQAPAAQPANPYADARPLSEVEADPVKPFAGSRPLREWPQAWML